MQTLSKQAETRLLSAVRSVVDHVDQGDHPTDAVAKVACEMSLPRGHLPLLCTAYNTGRVNAHRKSASGSILDRLDDIPLADHEAAARQLWPNEIETPSQAHAKVAVSDDYAKPPTWLNRTKPSVTTKAASVSAMPARTKDSAWKQLIDGQRQLEDLRPKSAAARDAMGVALTKLAGYFADKNCEPFAAVKFATADKLGDVGIALLRIVELQLGHEKSAAIAVPKYMQPVDWSTGPYKLIKEALAASERAIEARRALVAIEAAIKQAREEVYGSIGAHKSGAEKMGVGGSIFGSAIGSALSTTVPKPKSPGERVESKVTALDDPDHENALRNIQVHAMLRDFMSNDDVIKGYEPEEVLNAYNEIAQTAPTAATHAMAIRPLLRSALQRNWATHETSGLIDMERHLRGLQPVLSGGHPKSEGAK